MPGPTHDTDPLVTVCDRPAQDLAHVCFALCLAQRGSVSPIAHRSHGFGHGLEGRHAIPTMFDHIVPPALWIGITRCLGEGSQGVTNRPRQLRLGEAQLCFVVVGTGERHLHRKIHRPQRHVVFPSPGERLPFWAELGKRQEGSPLGTVDDVRQQRDRRYQVLMTNPRQGGFAVGRQLDQHHGRIELIEGAHDRPRRAGAVMADAQQRNGRCPVRGCHATPTTPGRLRRSRPNRPGHGPPLRDTHATPPCRGRGPSRRHRRSPQRRRRHSTDRRRNAQRARARW